MRSRSAATLGCVVAMIAIPALGARLPDDRTAVTRADRRAAEMPEWLREHLGMLTAGSGRWIADNAAYRSDEEPADAYGTEWEWSLGRESVTGRLFSLQDGREVATHWEFRVWWDPGSRRAIIAQWGASGIYGVGPLTPVNGAADTESDQQFAWPDGSLHRVRHHTVFDGDSKRTESFDWVDGAWEPRRTYVWNRQK